MDLFDNKIDEPINVISNDGIVDDYGALQSPADADDYFDKLLNNIEWKNDEAIFGIKIQHHIFLPLRSDSTIVLLS